MATKTRPWLDVRWHGHGRRRQALAADIRPAQCDWAAKALGMCSATQPKRALKLIGEPWAQARLAPSSGRGETPVVPSPVDEQDHTIHGSLHPPEPGGMGSRCRPHDISGRVVRFSLRVSLRTSVRLHHDRLRRFEAVAVR